MTFISLKYAYFLLITLVIYWLIPNRGWRLFVMLAASIRFYAFLQIEYIPLLLIGIVFNYRLAKAIGEPLDWRIANEAWNRRRFLLLWLGIVINISLLLGFKYVPFFLTSIGTFFNLPVALDSARWVNTNVISPLGLSFFCFECVAYLIDVYRGAPAANSLLQFASYKFFFPKLISGPITRYHNLLSQLKTLKFPTHDGIAEGLWLIASGAVKKGVFADNLGKLVTLSFDNLQRAGSGDLWLATIAYGLQLYLDFSGYVDMARGTALLMGLSLPQNFDFPYFSLSIADFWRRWHMSLGDWLRNYLYFPLGGSRVGLVRTCVNLLIVMLIAGIWHGAAWGFIIWGCLHGLALVVHRLTEVISKQLSLESFWQSLPGILVGWLLTQGMVFASWIFFRLPDLKISGLVFSHFWGYNADVQFAQKVYIEALGLERFQISWMVAVLVVAMGISYTLHRGLKLQLNWPLKLILVPLCLLALALAPEGGLPYIYFDF
ncbi:MBOAT family protein [Kamptonema animale CS-326]|jgi:alginate O-acetyltransferase complex protein AlgI|uniref:MBOAT family O-acyltransferase n=1 Tax=Kamptonema animale TaxID=92934 RepID=UPI00232F1F9C|nr:MBOAT family protein [Kamptonema animale]MDB9510543.1 MBOAT family protein [Kamptonema animale CS-326]